MSENKDQLQIEIKKLEDTLSIINEEKLALLEGRKKATSEIREYREDAIAEYTDDEDKLVEYFDHESYFKEQIYEVIDRRLREIMWLSLSPYFGRVDFKEKGGIEEEIYIGRFGLSDDKSGEPVVIDWRAPVASIFYAGKIGNVTYKSPDGVTDLNIIRKRQYIIKKSKLEGIFDSDVDIKDEILKMVLCKNTGDKLKEIVMTIQAEQDNIIRKGREKTVVVNGTAGSGKTTVALHRVAYLLYNYRKQLKDKVLIFGSNSIFMDYIKAVLPSLGEEGVKQTTFSDFAKKLLNIDNVMSIQDYMEKILAKDEGFITSLLYKNSDEYISYMDEFIHDLDENYFHLENVMFMDEVIVPAEAIYELKDYYKTMPLFRRTKKIKRIIFSKLKKVRDEKIAQIQKEYNEKAEKLSEGEKEYDAGNLEYLRSCAIRDIVDEVRKTKKQLSFLDAPDVVKIYEMFNKFKQLTVDDLAPILYLKVKLEGFKIKEEIKHIVIDEAQDYSGIQFKVIKEITGCTSMTITGDGNQRLIPLKGKLPMLEIEKYIQNINMEYYNLNRSYRSTKEIMNYAGKFTASENKISFLRDGSQVIEEEVKDLNILIEKIKNNIESFKQKGYESIGVVCRDENTSNTIGNMLKQKEKITILNSEEIIYSGGTVVVPSYFAKGLEFDAVIMIMETEEDKLNYVMATRALHELVVYN